MVSTFIISYNKNKIEQRTQNMTHPGLIPFHTGNRPTSHHKCMSSSFWNQKLNFQSSQIVGYFYILTLFSFFIICFISFVFPLIFLSPNIYFLEVKSTDWQKVGDNLESVSGSCDLIALFPDVKLMNIGNLFWKFPLHNRFICLMGRVFASGPGDLG